jgi:hypothetical protein
VGSIFLYSVLAGLLAGALSALATGVGGGNVVKGFIYAGVLGAIVSFIGLLEIQPTFSYFFDGGWGMEVFIIVIVGGGIGLFKAKDNTSAGMVGFIALIVAILVWAFPIPWMATSIRGWDAKNKMVNVLLPIDNAQENVVRIDPNTMIEVSPDYAHIKAGNVAPQQITSWSSVEKDGYLQGIDDGPLHGAYYVHEMTGKHNNWNEFNSSGGGKVPGFVVVDARDPKQDAKFIPLPADKNITLMPNAGWETGADLDLWLYTNIELPRRVLVKDIHGLEVDDKGNLHIIGTEVKPSEVGGTAAWYPVGIVDVNPTTREFVEVPLNEVAKKYPWLDRVYPLDIMTNLVKWYGERNNNTKPCWFLGIQCPKDGQLVIDGDPHVFYDGETYAQYVMTDTNADNKLVKEILQVSLKTGKATRISFTDANRSVLPSTITPLMETAASKINNRQPMHATLINMRGLAGSKVWVAVMEETVNGQNQFWGFAALLPELGKNPSSENIDVAHTISELEAKINQRLALLAARPANAQAGGVEADLQVKGRVGRISSSVVAGTTVLSFDVFGKLVGVPNAKEARYLFRMPTDSVQARYLREGDEVLVSAKQISTEAESDVTGLIDNSYPPTFAAPTPTVAPTAAPTP